MPSQPLVIQGSLVLVRWAMMVDGEFEHLVRFGLRGGLSSAVGQVWLSILDLSAWIGSSSCCMTGRSD